VVPEPVGLGREPEMQNVHENREGTKTWKPKQYGTGDDVVCTCVVVLLKVGKNDR
jgi:hypothetical protein